MPIHVSQLGLIIAVLTRSGVNGPCRKRAPTASNTAFAIAAPTGKVAGSPAPVDGVPGLSISDIRNSGTSGNLRIGYPRQSVLVTRTLSHLTSSNSDRLVA